MHYLGFAIVKSPTEEAVKEAMDDFHERHWDWYRCGGRWDGYLGGDEEMKRRETHDGFNFDEGNNCAARNSVRVSDYAGDAPHFFVTPDGYWIPREHYDEFVKSPHGERYGAIVPTPEFESRWEQAKAKFSDHFFVVVDAHN